MRCLEGQEGGYSLANCHNHPVSICEQQPAQYHIVDERQGGIHPLERGLQGPSICRCPGGTDRFYLQAAEATGAPSRAPGVIKEGPTAIEMFLPHSAPKAARMGHRGHRRLGGGVVT